MTGRSSIPETARLEPRSRGVLDGPVKPGHDRGGDMTKHSRGMICPSSAKAITLEVQRAQGMPVLRTHPQPCVQVKKARKQVTTGTPKRSGIPCAMVLRLLRDLPGVPGLIAPVAREWLHGLDPSVGGPGPHDLTVRAGALRLLAHRARPSHPAPRVMTIAIRPSVERGMAQLKTSDLPDGAS